MGRRKIEIEPITDERNRTVTFIKRKAGLFKKAHELAVLCQVDVTLIILGHNNTFYEFSSVDTSDLLDHYQNDKSLLHDIRDPSFYGKNFTKKNCIHNHNHNHDRNHTTTTTTTTTATTTSTTTAGATSTTEHRSKRSLHLLTNSHSNPNHLNKKFRIGLNNTSHSTTNTSSIANKTSLSNIIDSNSSSASKDAKLLSPLDSTSNSNLSSMSTSTSSNAQKKLSSRPILRVQIPHSNITKSTNSIKNEFSEINSNIYGNTSPQNYRVLSPDITNINNQNINLSTKQSSILKNKDSNSSTLLNNNQINTNNMATSASKMSNSSTAFSFSNGLPPLSAMSPYIATPLQNSNFHPPLVQTTTNNVATTTSSKTATSTNTKNGTNKFGLKLNINKINSSQRYPQQNIPNKTPSSIYSLASTPNSSTNNGNASNINTNNNTNNNNNNNSSFLSGSLPSKYINDLMIPSPTVFSNWNLNLGTQNTGTKFIAPPNPICPTNNTNTTNTSTSNSNISTTNSTTVNNNGNNNRSNSINDVSSSSSSSLVLAAQGYDPNNGNTGLTPYIGIGQTPLTNRFFNFSTSDINSPDTQIRKNEPLTSSTTPTTITAASTTTTTNIPNDANNIKTEGTDTPILDKDNTK